MNKETFKKAIKALEEQDKHDDKCSKAISIVYPNAFGVNLWYDNSILVDAILELLKAELGAASDWIEYYIYECDFGKNPNEVRVGKDVYNLDSVDNLWNLINAQ